MARLPDRTSLGQLPSARTGSAIASIRTSVADTSAIGRGVADLGRGIASLGDAANSINATLQARQGKVDTFNTEMAFQQYKFSREADLVENMKTVQPGATGFTDGVQGAYLEDTKKFFADIPEELRDKYELKLFGLERDLTRKAKLFELKEQERFSIANLDGIRENIQKDVRDGVLSLEEGKAKFERLNSLNPNTSGIKKDVLGREGLQKLEQSHADGLPPVERKKALSAPGKQVNALNLIAGFESFRAKSYLDRSTSGTKDAYRIGFGSDTITRADGSIITVTPGMKISREDAKRDLIRRGAEFAQRVQRQIGDEVWDRLPGNTRAALTSVAYNFGSLPNSVVAAVKGGDTEEIARSVESLRANPSRRKKEATVIRGGASGGAYSHLTDNQRQKLRDGADREIKALEAGAEKLRKKVAAVQAPLKPRKDVDSAGVAIEMQPETTISSNALMESLNTPLGGADVDAEESGRKALLIAEKAGDNILEGQKVLGVPVRSRKILSNDQAKFFVQRFSNMKPDQAAASFLDFKGKLGKHFPMVYRELTEQGLSSSYVLMGAVSDNLSDLNTVAQAIGQSEKTLKEFVPDANDLIKAVEADMAPFLRVFAFGNENRQQAIAMMDGFKKIALSHAQKTGDSIRAREITLDLMRSRFEIMDGGNKRILLPIESGATTGDVNTALAAAQSGAALKGFDPIVPGDSDNFLDKTATIRNASEQGIWITNPAGTGAILLYRFPNGETRPVKNNKGDFYEVMFEDMVGQSSAQPATLS